MPLEKIKSSFVQSDLNFVLFDFEEIFFTQNTVFVDTIILIAQNFSVLLVEDV